MWADPSDIIFLFFKHMFATLTDLRATTRIINLDYIKRIELVESQKGIAMLVLHHENGDIEKFQWCEITDEETTMDILYNKLEKRLGCISLDRW